MTPRTSIPILASLCLSLCACSDEPSETAMRTATGAFLGRMYNQQVAIASLITGRRPAQPLPTISAFRKLHCEPAQPLAGFLCAFEVGLDGRALAEDKGRFFKDADGTVTMAVAGL